MLGELFYLTIRLFKQPLKFQVMILADTAFGSVEFLHGIRKLKYHAITGVAVDRKER